MRTIPELTFDVKAHRDEEDEKGAAAVRSRLKNAPDGTELEVKTALESRVKGLEAEGWSSVGHIDLKMTGSKKTIRTHVMARAAVPRAAVVSSAG